MPTLTERLTDVSLVGAGVRRVRVTPRGPLSMLRGRVGGWTAHRAASRAGLLALPAPAPHVAARPDLPGHGHPRARRRLRAGRRRRAAVGGRRRCSPGPRSSSGAPRRARRGPSAPRARDRPGAGLAGGRAHVRSTRPSSTACGWRTTRRRATCGSELPLHPPPGVALGPRQLRDALRGPALDAVEPHHLLRAGLQQLRVPVHLLWGRATSCSPPDTSVVGPSPAAGLVGGARAARGPRALPGARGRGGPLDPGRPRRAPRGRRGRLMRRCPAVR